MSRKKKYTRKQLEKTKPFGVMAKDMRENVQPGVNRLNGAMESFGNSRFAKTIGFEYPKKR